MPRISDLTEVTDLDGNEFLAIVKDDRTQFTKISNIKTPGLKVLATLPAPSLALFEQSIYSITDNLEFVCVANTETPTTDAECFWFQR